MDPMTHWLRDPSRKPGEDAFFKVDRSAEVISRTVDVVPIGPNGPTKGAPGVATEFKGFKPKHDLRRIVTDNPFPHARKTQEGKKGVIDPALAGHASEATYTCFLSAEGRKLLEPGARREPLRVVILWGTGSQCTRQGVAGAVENAERPTLLINVSGVETDTKIRFAPPDDPLRTVEAVANNVWPIGCTDDLVEAAIRKFFPRSVDYQIDTLAAYSTGYLGLQESVNHRKLRIDNVRRVVFFDCLYGSLRAPLARIQALRSDVQIISYIATGEGNSFADRAHPSMPTLALKDMPGWTYINILFWYPWHAIASAHILNEGRSGPFPIIDSLPKAHLDALDALTAILPPRLSVISDEKAFRKVRGLPPPGAVSVAKFMETPANAKAVTDFHRQVAVTQQCLGYAQLLGWGMPAGEEWHEMVLPEFAWEYLS